MSISYNYFLPTNIYGTLRVTDLSFVGYTAVNANIYCQRNINSDGQMQCGSFKSLGASVFDQVPTCITNATTATQLTNLQTVQNLITAGGYITLTQAINGVHTSILPFTAIQTINNNLIITNATTTTSKTTISQNATTGQCIFTNQGNITGAYLFIGYNGATAINLLSITSSLCSITSTQINLNAVNLISLICTSTATFNGNYPTTTLGNNSGLNNNELATVGYVKSIGGSSILTLNNTWTGTNTFQIPIISSGSSLASNTIPALSIVNNSITNSQIASGFQLITINSQTFSGVKTLSNLLNSTGITDTVSISSPLVSGGYFQATGTTTSTLNNTSITGTLNVNNINTSASTPLTLSISTVALPVSTNAGAGLQIGWNGNAGVGQTDIINLAQGGTGGFQFATISNTISYRALCAMNPYSNQGFWLFSNCGRLRIDDRNGGAFWWGQSMEGSQMIMGSNGVSTSITLYCSNASGIGSTCLSINTSAVSPNVNLNPLSTTTFNVSHPTSTLATNISTNTTEYALVSYVNANSATALLASNNTWTGTNSYTKNQISIGSGVSQVYVGNSTGNQQSIIIGDPTSLATITASSNCISVGTQSLRLSTGSNNLSFGSANYPALTTGNNNISIGTSNGGGITTGLNNIIIGTSSWATGNFSNCTVIGNVVPAPLASNSIVLGGTTETVYINGSSQLNNSLLYGTTVCSSDVLQINNQTKRFHTVYTTGVNNTLTNPLPFMILFTPIAGMGFILPVPSATNAGQTFIIRRYATGGGQTINFTVTGGGAVFLPLNSGTAIANIAISTVWQFTFYSTGSQYIAIA